MQPIELLCPAKNVDFGKAAINYGADAVYIGASNFGARAAASNTLSDIEQLCRYAHAYNAKVYIALNTILYENELEQARRLIYDVWNAGADALIVQDMSILEMDIPPIRLHASTQAHNFDLNRISFLEKSGMSRVVLARELSLTEIETIRKNSTIELESFIHGALCVSLSGQCYFSHATTKRSANRGECSQSCRMPYNLVDNNGKMLVENRHLLSLKDFDASNHIRQLVEAGVQSFKIEGRLKDKSYVINNTAFYRQMIDDIIEHDSKYCKASDGSTEISFQPDTSRTFNRGYSTYFLSGRSQNIISPLTPKSMGKFVGVVSRVEPDCIYVNSNEELKNGDGLCFINKLNELTGFSINKIDGNKVFIADTTSILHGTELYRNYDHAFEKKLLADNSKRRIDVKVTFAETTNGVSLNVSDQKGVSTLIVSEVDKSPARDSESAYSNIERQLKKSGDTIFNVTEVSVLLEKPLFFKASQLNELRRTALEAHQNNRIATYERLTKNSGETSAAYPEKTVHYNANVSNSLAKKFYEKHGAGVAEDAFELLSDDKWLSKPIMTTRYCIKFELGMCPSKQKFKNDDVFAEPLFLEDKNRRYRLSFDCKNCMMLVFLNK
jgi:23S rRNA 5-hydroxycytidine C2501 synthase